MVLKTMRFYGWSWQQTMHTPISAFFTCNEYIDRLRADETMSRLPELDWAWADGESKRKLMADLQQRVGTVVLEDAVFDREGWETLRNLTKH